MATKTVKKITKKTEVRRHEMASPLGGKVAKTEVKTEDKQSLAILTNGKQSLPIRTAQGKKDMKKVTKTNKTLTGVVVSTKMKNTIVVAIERKVAHKLYRKLIKVTKKIKADTNNMKVEEGDMVVIEQTRPLSKDKNFKLIRKEEKK